MTEKLPTLPGRVHGLVGENPWRIQCDGCGRIDDYKSLGLGKDSNIVLIISTIKLSHTDGYTQRLCKECRAAQKGGTS